ncbi:MAG: Abi family protein [Oscillospiraceae bacterium]|jgi:abortive infection bacteriophage resistance protein|nr:Abi family protein [Oscillospiraceae bacterium]
MPIKKPKTFDEQIEILQKRGCIIPDKVWAKSVLEQLNYYRLSAYFLPFKKKDGTYIKETTLNNVYRIYEFDRKMRNLILLVAEEIEIYLRTQLAYYHSMKYGAIGYLDAANFSTSHNHELFLESVNEFIEKNKTKPFVKHHLQKHNGNFPLWVAVEMFTFGTLSYFYADMELSDQKQFASYAYAANYDKLGSWFKCANLIRNSCAHYSRLYNSVFPFVPKTPLGFKYTLNRKLFDYILVLKFLSVDINKWKTFVTNLNALVYEYNDVIVLSCIGFPVNWEEILLLPQSFYTVTNKKA